MGQAIAAAPDDDPAAAGEKKSERRQGLANSDSSGVVTEESVPRRQRLQRYCVSVIFDYNDMEASSMAEADKMAVRMFFEGLKSMARSNIQAAVNLVRVSDSSLWSSSYFVKSSSSICQQGTCGNDTSRDKHNNNNNTTIVVINKKRAKSLPEHVVHKTSCELHSD